MIAFPFSVYPVKSGGAQRGYHILRELAREFCTEALVVDHPEEIQESVSEELGADLVGLRVRQIEQLRQRTGLARKIANRIRTFSYCRSLAVSSNTAMIATARMLKVTIRHRQPRAVVLTNLESWICGSMLGRTCPSTHRIIDMYNLEHVLRAQQLESAGGNVEGDREFLRLKRETANLYRCADAVFACSDDDRDVVANLTLGRIQCETVPNGVACEHAPMDDRADKNGSKDIIFCGSLSYPPNLDGLNWFCQDVWPEIRRRHAEARLNVVGRGYEEANLIKLRDDPAVSLVGEVDDLRPHYHRSGVSICPLRMGSGTRLKILESMSFGNPVVTTSMGCEGITVQDGVHLMIRDDAESFADAVSALLEDKVQFDRLRGSARRLVEASYDWRVIGQSAVNHIKGVVNARRAGSSGVDGQD